MSTMTKTTKNKCPNCGRENDIVVTAVVNGKLYNGCEDCISEAPKSAELSAKYKREWQKKEYRRELTQPNQKEFAKAYPDKFRETHGDDLYRKFG